MVVTSNSSDDSSRNAELVLKISEDVSEGGKEPPEKNDSNGVKNLEKSVPEDTPKTGQTLGENLIKKHTQKRVSFSDSITGEDTKDESATKTDSEVSDSLTGEDTKDESATKTDSEVSSTLDKPPSEESSQVKPNNDDPSSKDVSEGKSTKVEASSEEESGEISTGNESSANKDPEGASSSTEDADPKSNLHESSLNECFHNQDTEEKSVKTESRVTNESTPNKYPEDAFSSTEDSERRSKQNESLTKADSEQISSLNEPFTKPGSEEDSLTKGDIDSRSNLDESSSKVESETMASADDSTSKSSNLNGSEATLPLDECFAKNSKEKIVHDDFHSRRRSSHRIRTRSISSYNDRRKSIDLPPPFSLPPDPSPIESGLKEEVSSIDGKMEEITVYRTRFWILGLFAYTAFLEMLFWGTFGPIMESAQYAFMWDDWFISLLEGLGTLFSFVCMVPFNWATQKYGLRFGMLLLLSIISFGTGIRCFTLEDKAFTYLASAGAIASGMSACLTFSIPAMLSSTWFPASERATATAVGSLASQFGAAGMYLAPLFVRSPKDDPTLTRDDVKGDIRILMLLQFGMAALALVCTLIYFPEKPPTSPSVSSTVKRINYFDGLKMVLKSPQVLLVVVSYTISMALPLSWITIINFSLRCLDITQHEAMWIAIAACTASPILAFIIARISDHLYGHLKISIMGLLFCSSWFFLWFLLMTEGVIPPNKDYVFVAVVFAISLQYSSVPLLIELAVELAYPCPESVVGAILSFLMDVADTIFFLLLMIHSQCYRWVSFVLLGCTTVPIGTMFFVKEVYKRSNCDH